MADVYRSFGDFILFKEIQADDLGHLFRAGEFDESGVKRTVWLRLFDGDKVPRPELVKSFDTGRQVADLLQSSNVASGVRYFEDDGIPAMASDYMAGRPLSRLFEKVQEEGFPVPVDNALLIMEKLALGLSSALVLDAGGQSLVHGFLHPGLVVVTNDGEAVVSGFGIAEKLLELLDDESAANNIAPYLSPEVIANQTTAKRGDVYSLGAILFQLLTDSPLPVEPAERAAALENAELSYDGEPIPADIKALLGRALAARPEERFSSAADFKKELDKLLYGGNYSPTTFNLALFMDRLFRSDIEADEKDVAAETAVDVTDYLKPEPEPEPIAEEAAAGSTGGGRSMYYAIAAGLLLIAVVVVFMMSRGSTPPPAPELTPEQKAAQKAAQEEKIRELAARMVEEKMAEKEAEILKQLEERQQHIESLQRKLEQSQRAPAAAGEQQRQDQQEIQRQLRAAQEEQRRQEEALEAEKQRLLEQARKDAEEAARKQALAALAAETQQAQAQPEEVPDESTAAPQGPAGPTDSQPESASATVKENQFIDPTELDSLPAIIKSEPVQWPRSAQRSRRRGIVVMQATVNAQGRVEAVKILRTDESGFGIPEAATEAVEKYLFKPGIKDGVKVKTYATVTERYVFR